jgi:hypothetical protein
MELVLVELDTSAELHVTECAEVVDAELIGGTDLGSGRGKRMECGRDGRRESGRLAGNAGRGGADERRGWSPSREWGRAKSVP